MQPCGHVHLRDCRHLAGGARTGHRVELAATMRKRELGSPHSQSRELVPRPKQGFKLDPASSANCTG